MYEDRKSPDGRWEPAGLHGAFWQNYMRDFYPEECQELIEKDLFFPIAYKVEDEWSRKFDELVEVITDNRELMDTLRRDVVNVKRTSL